MTQKKYASLASLQTFLNNIGSKFATKATVEELSSEVAYINSTNNETITDVVIPEGGGGSGIDVTAEVGQTIVVKEVDANGKPTKWESADYQPRTHYQGIVELYNATLTGLVESEALIEGFSMQAGETYYITWNGVEYTCVCVEVPDTGGMRYIGNSSVFELEDTEDTGEPFCILYGTADGVNFDTLVISLDGVDEATVVIKGTGYIPIPQEYLTNAFPYYIEVTGSGTDEDPYVCADTVGDVEAIMKSGRAVVATRILPQYGTSTAEPPTGYSRDMFPLYSCIGRYDNPIGEALIFGFTSSRMLVFAPQEDGTYSVSDKL